MSTKQNIKQETSEILDSTLEFLSLGLLEEAPKPVKQIKNGTIDVIGGGIEVTKGIFNTFTFGLFDSDED